MKKIKKCDIYLIALLLIFEIILIPVLLFQNQSKSATVFTDKETIKIDLSSDKEYEIESNGIKLILSVENGEICVKSSECKNHICVNTGKIGKHGGTIVCSPAKVLIMTSYKKGDLNYDEVIG